MSEAKKYTGGCHCGKVRYAVTLSLGEVMSCNCSMCSRKGGLLTFTGTEQFELLSGKDAVTDYQFNTMNIHHLFCSTCGVTSYTTGTGPGGKTMYAVNVRCLDDVDLSALPVKHFDGKSL
jgi:hypothetical protein